MTQCDKIILRNRTGINVQCVDTSSVIHSGKVKEEDLVLRLLFKPVTGTLWAFNRPQLDQQNFTEIPEPENFGVVPNTFDQSKEKQEMEEDEENDVELKRTMWLIIRKKRSVNEVLKDFFPDYQQ